ncbi:MAG: hypothetical protein E6K77_03665 [Candidatus Eisenbacteria bacterium]|uniref:Tetratricopeptide repeat protein n=1 Tax=Eiseniibacteriota bacterium TaxID=2212470 RepID=A0A538TLV9_UNCEI|nr:MAG: hypothetical protein E6K77_03665 [Candidatus Eisenbacteria bacterium]
MRPSGLALMLALILATARPSLASLPPQTQEVIARYLAELNRVESVRGRTSIEPLFALTDTLQEYLFYGELLENRNWSQKEHPPTMEDLSESEYAELSKQLRGILLNRDEVVIAEPDSSTFLPLARRKGLKPDRDFMDVYFMTRPCAWPAYVVQETDYSGCDDYGTGKIVTLYGEWRRYRSAHPKNYVSAATQQLEEIQNSLADPGSPCGGPDSVTRELQQFLSRFPNDPITPKVRDVLNAIQQGRSNIRFPRGSN